MCPGMFNSLLANNYAWYNCSYKNGKGFHWKSFAVTYQAFSMCALTFWYIHAKAKLDISLPLLSTHITHARKHACTTHTHTHTHARTHTHTHTHAHTHFQGWWKQLLIGPAISLHQSKSRF